MKRLQKGQTLLIVLLIFTVVVTIGLALIGRSTTDVSLTERVEESARAFAAAEAGIEESLQTGLSSNVTLISGTEFISDVSVLGGGGSVYTPNEALQIGESKAVFLVGHNDNGTLNESDVNGYKGSTIDVCWRHGGVAPALEIDVYYKVGNQYYVERGAYDPDDETRVTNQFSDVTDEINGCGTTGVYKVTVAMPSASGAVPLMLLVRPYKSYASIMVEPAGGALLPVQGKEIVSTGTSGSGVSRRILVQVGYKVPLSFLDFAIYSQGSFSR